jgi:L-2-hydroxyglutarate oxidase LhgO
VVVIGGGIVGLATAYQLLGAAHRHRVIVFEKEARVGLHQSTHNSGVLHSGVYYPPGSLKAQLCVRGRQSIEGLAERHAIPLRRTGKVLVAVDSSEFGRFERLVERVIGPEELRELEPHVQGLRALHCPTTAVIDFGLVCEALVADIRGAGGEVRTSAEVVDIGEEGHGLRITSLAGEVQARVAVVCAGLQADRLAAMSGRRPDVRVVPFRGSWDVLRPPAAAMVQGSVYPVPDPRFPFLGVHLTRRVDGAVWAGPNAVLAGGRESYARGSLNLRETAAVMAFPGAWRMAGRHLGTGMTELFRDRVRHARLRQMRRYLPELTLDDLLPGPTGIRAQAVRRDGTLVDDFLVEGDARTVHVLNAPSPAATSSLAIGEMLAAAVAERLA